MQVLERGNQDSRVISEQTDSPVATITQQPPVVSRCVIVVSAQPLTLRNPPTDRASTGLLTQGPPEIPLLHAGFMSQRSAQRSVSVTRTAARSTSIGRAAVHRKGVGRFALVAVPARQRHANNWLVLVLNPVRPSAVRTVRLLDRRLGTTTTRANQAHRALASGPSAMATISVIMRSHSAGPRCGASSAISA